MYFLNIKITNEYVRGGDFTKTMSDNNNCSVSRLTRRAVESTTRSFDWPYGDENNTGGTQSYSVLDKLNSTRYERFDFVIKMDGKHFTIPFLQKHGFSFPFIFKDKIGLGLKVSGRHFSVDNVCKYVGPTKTLSVIDLNTHNTLEMSMLQWAKYYKNPLKDKLLYFAKLEISCTKLGDFITPPNIVQELDWVNCFWPSRLKGSKKSTNVINQMMYPKVQKYCLMFVKSSFIDFNINFCGASAWYYILKGILVFWLIPPTEQNIALYEKWKLSDNWDNTFFGDAVEQCSRVSLNVGDTFFIPTGWICGQYTIEDSLVLSGYFLHSLEIIKQLRIANVEVTIKVHEKFRYPLFTEMLWYVLERYVFYYSGKSHFIVQDESPASLIKYIHFSIPKIHDIIAIVRYLGNLPEHKKEIPSLINNISELINDVNIIINKHKDSPVNVINVKQIINQKDNKQGKQFYKSDIVEQKPNNKIIQNKRIKSKKERVIITRKKQEYRKCQEKKNIVSTSTNSRQRRKRCKQCYACKQTNCGKCSFCIDMVKFGGAGRIKQSCIMRQCLQPMFPITATCGICSLDGWGQQIIDPTQIAVKDTPSNLMECSICYEIVHPDCMLKEHVVFTNIGTYNEDLPNSWICPKCYMEGKYLEMKPRHFLARQKSKNILQTGVCSMNTNSQYDANENTVYHDKISESDSSNIITLTDWHSTGSENFF